MPPSAITTSHNNNGNTTSGDEPSHARHERAKRCASFDVTPRAAPKPAAELGVYLQAEAGTPDAAQAQAGGPVSGIGVLTELATKDDATHSTALQGVILRIEVASPLETKLMSYLMVAAILGGLAASVTIKASSARRTG